MPPLIGWAAAHGSLTAGRWDRSSFSGVELYEKTLGVLGFGRIGQLVAQRALGFGMRVVAFDAYVAEERFRELGVERAETSDQLYAQADFTVESRDVPHETIVDEILEGLRRRLAPESAAAGPAVSEGSPPGGTAP